MNRKLKSALLEAGIIGGFVVVLICASEAARDKLKREHGWDNALATESGRVNASAQD